MAGSRPPVSLKARALRWVAQREHSTVELRGKLLQAARRQAGLQEARRLAALREAVDPHPADSPDNDTPGHDRTAALLAQVDEVVAWMQAHDFLSDTRFVESRVHARAAVQGTLRIRRELAGHGLALPEAHLQALHDTEIERARALRLRRFGDAPAATPQEQARQYRFLVQRGFAGDVVTKVLRSSRRAA